MQYGLSVRDSRIADASQSNGFESDNNASGSTAEPYTTATFSNITFLGPKTFDASFTNDKTYINGGGINPENGSSMGLFQAAMHIRRNSRLNVNNTLAIGWPIGLILDNEKGNTQGAATNGQMKLNGITFVGMDIVGSDFNKVYKDEFYDYATKTTDATKPSFTSNFFQLAANQNAVVGNWMAHTWNGIASILAISKQYPGIGAFPDGQDWTAGWANFDPQNAQY